MQGIADGTPVNLADEEIPPLIVKATDFGRADHLVTVVRSLILSIIWLPLLSSQKPNSGGTGKIAYDPKQRDIRAFFSGATKAFTTEHCESNALDGVDGELKH